ncbi:MAG TPA: ATP-grasp domain-containing protein, partial [Thermoplasmata archaeon]|nr:ATP-grasp domain-containing protein [Thermoplasmata archaeon]
MDKIIDSALHVGADGIHPGYGFLAENAIFARKCRENGIKFIGPTAEAIEHMGSKIKSKVTMKEHGVPVIPGGLEPIKNEGHAYKEAERIGYPVMLKPSAGGGGIGMAIVYNEDELGETLEKTRELAKKNFGDDTILIEKFLTAPRHIEFQILCDEHGNKIHVRERECSIQRRHQKLVEETPSPVMTPELREKMGEAAVRAAEAIDYINAGTVEFMYSNGDFYFLEMNTRLQVEHPITEMITRIDLAQEQLRIASGLELQYRQEDIKGHGHAIECRINADDPQNNMMPSPGEITQYISPGGMGVRVDSGVYQGFTVPSTYDSLLAKLIVWGRDRKEAIVRMRRALSEFVIRGPKTNIPFHEVVMNHPAFVKGDYDTNFISRHDIMSVVNYYMERKKLFLEERKKKLAAAMAAVEEHYKRMAEKSGK